MRTASQERGDGAEDLIAERLRRAGWSILGRQVRVGRAEIDIIAVDPGPPRELVAVEVRWRSRRDFGLAEESVQHVKLRRLRGAVARLLEAGQLADGTVIPRIMPRVDVVAVEPGPTPADPIVRHHRSVG